MNKKLVAYYNMPGDLNYELDLLKKWNVTDIKLVQVNTPDKSNIIADLQGFHGLVTEYTIIDENILSTMPDLEIIALQSIGYDEIDVTAARKYGIDVTNAPGYCAEDVAMHAMALFLSIIRKTVFYNAETHQGNWNPFAGPTMNRVSSKTAGLVSFGSIPQKLVPMLKGFGIEVVSFDPGVSKEFMEQNGVYKCESLDALFEMSDFIFLHSPLIEQTVHMINKDSIAHMKEDAVLINVARGGLVCEEDLIAALKNGKFRGVGLDVLENEKELTTALFNFENVIITPHTAFLSEESLKQSRRMALEQLVQKLSEKKSPSLKVN